MGEGGEVDKGGGEDEVGVVRVGRQCCLPPLTERHVHVIEHHIIQNIPVTNRLVYDPHPHTR